MIQLAMVRGIQVVEHHTHGYSGKRGVIQPEALQRSGPKLLLDQVVGMGLCEHPIVEFGACHVVPKQGAYVSFTLAVDEPLLGSRLRRMRSIQRASPSAAWNSPVLKSSKANPTAFDVQ